MMAIFDVNSQFCEQQQPEQVVQRSFVLGQKAQQRTKNSNENKSRKATDYLLKVVD